MAWRPLGIARSLPGILDAQINGSSLIRDVTQTMKINGSEKFDGSRVTKIRRHLFPLKENIRSRY